jgi:hypothetical protein
LGLCFALQIANPTERNKLQLVFIKAVHYCGKEKVQQISPSNNTFLTKVETPKASVHPAWEAKNRISCKRSKSLELFHTDFPIGAGIHSMT